MESQNFSPSNPVENLLSSILEQQSKSLFNQNLTYSELSISGSFSDLIEEEISNLSIKIAESKTQSQQLNSVDSSGDEGDIFARLVQGETINAVALEGLKAEDDSGTIFLNGKEILVELAEPPYPGYLFTYSPGEALSYDANVEVWQQQMKDRGWNIDVDGFYGPQSENIARQFQQAKDLAVDGIVGPQTWEATFDTSTPPFPGYLFSYSSGETVTYDANVEMWQQKMKDRGWDILVDGLFGPQSESIARQFQEQEGLLVDGIVGVQTWEATFDGEVAPPPPPEEPPPPPEEPSPSSFRDNVVNIAYEEWEYFEQGNLLEYQPGAIERIGEYWQNLGLDYTGLDTNQPWSAAFISWVMNEAGDDGTFNDSALHADYINQAILDRDSDAAFIAYDIDEYSPQVGDLIAQNREEDEGSEITVTYEDAVNYTYNSHVDIVVAVRPGEIDVIGGNVNNSVDIETYDIDSEGRIINPDDGTEINDFFAVIVPQLDESTPPAPTPLPEGVNPDPLYSEYSGEFTVTDDFSDNMRAFLDTISYAEGTFLPEGYRVIVGYDDGPFESFEAHPNIYVEELDSTAAGRYQFLYDTWVGTQEALELPDFSPASQDLGAVYLIEGEGADENVEAGNFEDAIYAVNNIWASLPGSPYGQPTKDFDELLGFYDERVDFYGNA